CRPFHNRCARRTGRRSGSAGREVPRRRAARSRGGGAGHPWPRNRRTARPAAQSFARLPRRERGAPRHSGGRWRRRDGGAIGMNTLASALDSTPVRLTLFLALAVFGCAPLMTAPRAGGLTLDWQFFQFFDEIARRTIAEYHQFPIWNPYFCGGTTMVG